MNIHIIRPNDRKTHARCKVVGMDTEGLGAKHRKCFFFMVESTQFCSFERKLKNNVIIKYFVVQNLLLL